MEQENKKQYELALEKYPKLFQLYSKKIGVDSDFANEIQERARVYMITGNQTNKISIDHALIRQGRDENDKVSKASLENLKTTLRRVFVNGQTKTIAPALAQLMLLSTNQYNLDDIDSKNRLQRDADELIADWKKKNNSDKKQINIPPQLLGKWLVYISAPSGVHRTYLDILEDKPATYLSKHGITCEGQAMFNDGQLLILMSGAKGKKGYHLTVRAYVSPSALKESQLKISGIMLANGNIEKVNYVLPIILLKPTKSNVAKKFLTAALDFSKKVKPKEFIPKGAVEKNIVSYLALKPWTSTDYLSSESKSINSLIRERLEEKGRNDYMTSERAFLAKTKWVSLSRSEDNTTARLSVYYWKFLFNDVNQSIRVETYANKDRTGTNFFRGELSVHGEEYWIHLHNSRKQKFLFGKKQIHITGPSDASGEESKENLEMDKIVQLLSSYEGGRANQHFAVREILMPESYLPVGFKGIYLPYEKFLEMDKPRNSTKMYLNYNRHSMLSYPSNEPESTRYGKERKASFYEGRYFVYVKGVYPEIKNEIIRFTLDIDSLARAELWKKLDYGEGNFYYIGIAEKLNETLYLHLSNQNVNRKQACRILFHVTDGAKHGAATRSSILIGILLDSDKESYPIASICVALKVEGKLASTEFAPLKSISNNMIGNDKEEDILWEKVDQLYKGKYLECFGREIESLEDFFAVTTQSRGTMQLFDQYLARKPNSKEQK